MDESDSDDDTEDDDDDEESYAITSYTTYDEDYEEAMYEAINATSSLFFDEFFAI
jgi:hypothetical protein